MTRGRDKNTVTSRYPLLFILAPSPSHIIRNMWYFTLCQKSISKGAAAVAQLVVCSPRMWKGECSIPGRDVPCIVTVPLPIARIQQHKYKSWKQVYGQFHSQTLESNNTNPIRWIRYSDSSIAKRSTTGVSVRGPRLSRDCPRGPYQRMS